MIQAAGSGQFSLCKLLLDHKAKIDLRNDYGTTALMNAARMGHNEICNLLIVHGADLDVQSNVSTPSPVDCTLLCSSLYN